MYSGGYNVIGFLVKNESNVGWVSPAKSGRNPPYWIPAFAGIGMKNYLLTVPLKLVPYLIREPVSRNNMAETKGTANLLSLFGLFVLG